MCLKVARAILEEKYAISFKNELLLFYIIYTAAVSIPALSYLNTIEHVAASAEL